MAPRIRQEAFHKALLNPECAAPEGLIDGQGRAAGRRFDIYRNNVTVSLSAALEDSFPAIRKLLGKENFTNIARLYARTHPPKSPIMSQYGTGFAEFLKAFPPLAHLPYLADVARLEQALRDAYHAADAAPITPAALQSVPAEALPTLKLTLAPSVRVLRSDYPVHAVWAYNMQTGSPKPAPGAQAVLIVRPEFDPIPLPVPEADALCIDALRTGLSLGAAADRATECDPDFDLAPCLGRLLSHAAISSICTKEDQ
ncbi:MAG: DNA-binding domain-containing protein [Pseudomonadota bacterium]